MLSTDGTGGLTLATLAAAPIYLATNNVTAVTIDANQNLGVCVIPPNVNINYKVIHLGAIGNSLMFSNNSGQSNYINSNYYYNGTNDIYASNAAATSFAFGPNVPGYLWRISPAGTAGATISWTNAMSLDLSGNLNVGITGAPNHAVVKTVTADANAAILGIGTPNINVATFTGVSVGSNAGAAALRLGKDNTTGYSTRNAGNTSAAGADYAEYRLLTSLLYGKVAKGDLLGYDAHGLMTNLFADVVGRVLPKSSDPSFVGNDIWNISANICAAYGVAEPGSSTLSDGAPDPDYEIRLEAFNAALESERVKWDRIALCGVVPVNLTGLTAADVGKYLVPCAAADGTITATTVAKAELTLAQYIDSFGTIEMIGADGRPLVNVKNG
jgi:hypothetical protein